jgi:DUF1680 family protein
VKPKAGTYAAIQRVWKAGDVVELTLPMKPRLVVAHPWVEECRNQVAVVRGPVVYCLESPDLPEGTHVSAVRIPRDIQFTCRFDPNLLGGVTALEGLAQAEDEDDWTGTLYRDLSCPRRREVPIRLVPYYAWANRGVSEMTVWMPLA